MTQCHRLSSRCKIVQNQELKRICISNYPGDAIIKYRDEMVSSKEIYTVFQFPEDHRNYFFLSIGESTINNCARLKVTDHNTFMCMTVEGNWDDIGIIDGFIICLESDLYLADDLIRYCAPYSIGPAAFAAYHYSAIGKKRLVSAGDKNQTSSESLMKLLVIMWVLRIRIYVH